MCIFWREELGQPGSPGGNDLTRALHRLSLRRQNFLCERQFFQAERERKLQALSDGDGSGCSSPMGSVISSFSNLSETSLGSSVFKTFLPEKLQIVKPMEGRLAVQLNSTVVAKQNLTEFKRGQIKKTKQKILINLSNFHRLIDAPPLAAACQTTPGHHPGPSPWCGD